MEGIERIGELLEGYLLCEEDREALKEALEEHKAGKTISLDEAERMLGIKQ